MRDHTEAMELFLHEVVVPLFYFHMGDVNHERCCCTDPLVKDGRIILLMRTYLPNLWRVFLHFAQDLGNRIPPISDEDKPISPEFGTFQPLPAQLAFPKIAQASERALFEGVTRLPTFTSDSSAGNQVYTIHESGMLRFCENFGLNELVSSRDILTTYRAVISNRVKLKNFAPPKGQVKLNPRKTPPPVRGGKARTPTRKGPGSTISGSPAFKPVGARATSERIREQEFRERSGSLIKTRHMGK